jgi:hypothetical protein
MLEEPLEALEYMGLSTKVLVGVCLLMVVLLAVWQLLIQSHRHWEAKLQQ